MITRMGKVYRITEHDARAFTDVEIAQGAELEALVDAERWPDDPPLPVDAVIASARRTGSDPPVGDPRLGTRRGSRRSCLLRDRSRA